MGHGLDFTAAATCAAAVPAWVLFVALYLRSACACNLVDVANFADSSLFVFVIPCAGRTGCRMLSFMTLMPALNLGTFPMFAATRSLQSVDLQEAMERDRVMLHGLTSVHVVCMDGVANFFACTCKADSRGQMWSPRSTADRVSHKTVDAFFHRYPTRCSHAALATREANTLLCVNSPDLKREEYTCELSCTDPICSSSTHNVPANLVDGPSQDAQAVQESALVLGCETVVVCCGPTPSPAIVVRRQVAPEGSIMWYCQQCPDGFNCAHVTAARAEASSVRVEQDAVERSRPPEVITCVTNDKVPFPGDPDGPIAHAAAQRGMGGATAEDFLPTQFGPAVQCSCGGTAEPGSVCQQEGTRFHLTMRMKVSVEWSKCNLCGKKMSYDRMQECGIFNLDNR